MKIYFVRHGKTEWNLERRFQGYSGDSPLLAQAIEDIEACGDYLADVHFDAIFSSDAGRAKTTTQLLMAKQVPQPPVTYTSQLREWNYGTLEGTKIDLMKDLYPKEFWNFRNNLACFDHTIFSAESPYQATKRILDFIQTLKGQAYETVLLVGHGAIFTASIRTLLGYPVSDLRKNGSLDNGSISILETQDFKQFTLLDWNDTNYKSEEG